MTQIYGTLLENGDRNNWKRLNGKETTLLHWFRCSRGLTNYE